MLSEFEIELLNKLDQMINLIKNQCDTIGQLHKLLNQYNSDYLSEIEKQRTNIPID